MKTVAEKTDNEILEFRQKVEQEKLYYSYSKTSREIILTYWKTSITVLFYSFLAMFIGIGCFVTGNLFFRELGYALVRLLSWGFWLMLLFSVYIGLSGGINANKQFKNDIARMNRSKTGFINFFELYRKHYWPREMVAGEKLDRFLLIIGHNGYAQ
jgi:hypothetical protein